MLIRRLTKPDYNYIVSHLDTWWGGPSRELAHPMFFYELGGLATVAELDGEVIGFLFGFDVPIDSTEHVPVESGFSELSERARQRVSYIHMVGIHPDHRRKGVGKQLYEHFLKQAEGRGLDAIKAITNVGNEGSIRFHEALGFAVEVQPDYAGANRSRIVFQKALNKDI